MSVIFLLFLMFFSNVNSELQRHSNKSHFELLVQTIPSFVLCLTNILCLESQIRIQVDCSYLDIRLF